MKRTLTMLIAALALSGCSTLTPSGEGAEVNNKFDLEYMAVVENQARHLGTEVIWVNPPRRSDDSER